MVQNRGAEAMSLASEKVLLENDRVRVIEVRLSPGEKMGMHTHPTYIAYTVSPAKLRFTFPDGGSQEIQTVQASASYSEGVTHTVENIGSTQLVSIDIELKK
jgi:quercetin dioxygenase-like cupin family protein